MYQLYYFIVILFCFNSGFTQSYGDSCDENGVPGQCLPLQNCTSALQNPSTRRNLKRCGFDGREPIVCCVDISSNPVGTPAFIQSTTTEYVPSLNNYSNIEVADSTCDPLSERLTAPKTEKAWDSYGDSCDENGVPGQCLPLQNCTSALRDPSVRSNLKRCGFDGREPIVCCVDISSNPVGTPASIQSTTTEYVPPLNEYEYSDIEAADSTCDPLSERLTAPKIGRTAWDKCVEYQEQLVYPCERGEDILGNMVRGNHCGLNKMDQLLVGVGGSEAKRKEFPHMALLSFENPDGPICGGTVISDRFIMTAGHCTYYKGSHVSTAKVGLLYRTEDVPASNIYAIKRIIKHPEYQAPTKYNDIALLETDRQIKLDHTVIPACLDIGDENATHASATGWGHTAYLGEMSDVLIKVPLVKFNTSECARRYKKDRRYLTRGYDESSQLCYGDHTEARDTCQGDSGGPLQVLNSRIQCMYTVIGVTSYGKACGIIDFPGIYTRVATFTPWIESIVWP